MAAALQTQVMAQACMAVLCPKPCAGHGQGQNQNCASEGNRICSRAQASQESHPAQASQLPCLL